MRWSAFHLSGILLLIGVSAHILAAEIDSERAADLKAVWLARIPEYAAWPDTDNRRSSTAPVRIGVLGRDPNGVIDVIRPEIEKPDGLTAKGRRLQLMDLNLSLANADPASLNAVLKTCDLLFFSDDAFARWPQLQPILESLPILTVGESPGFAESGGVVEFYPDPIKNQLVMRINLPAMRRTGVTLSSTILTLSNVVVLEREAKAE
jgi:hypothetical protein